MNANELRIGNLVYHNDEIIQIESLHSKDDDVNDEIPFHSIFGIKITEEWLLRFGFEEAFKSSIHSTYWVEGMAYYFWYEKDNQYANHQGIHINCQYIHELQNLYFALTGEELTIKN